MLMSLCLITIVLSFVMSLAPFLSLTLSLCSPVFLDQRVASVVETNKH